MLVGTTLIYANPPLELFGGSSQVVVAIATLGNRYSNVAGSSINGYR